MGLPVSRMLLEGVRYLCVVDVLAALGYATPDRQVTHVKHLKMSDGTSALIEVGVRTNGVVRDVLFLAEIAAIPFVLRSHAAAQDGSPQQAFSAALVERAFAGGCGTAMIEAYERRLAIVTRALRLSEVRNVRLFVENKEFRRVASRARKEVAAAQDEVLVVKDRSMSRSTIGDSARRDAETSRLAASDAERKLAEANRRIMSLAAKNAALEASLSSIKREHGREIGVLKTALLEKSEVAAVALAMFRRSAT